MLLGLAVMVAGAGVGGAGEASAAGTPPPVLPSGKSYTVTLLTGDVVTVTTRQQGCPLVSVRPAKPSGVQFRSCGPDGHVRVVPGEVAGLVGSVLDESLFDVTALIQDGYDDARSAELPVIVRPGTGLAADRAARGLGERRTLSAIGAVSGRQPKGRGAELLRTVAGAPNAKVWLDRRVRATAVRGLDANLRQVSAPQAWRSGATGQGVRVAVLDTGADFDHPDLAGQVVERRDFSVEGGDAVDRFGHGTHVAATIAGTGAAAAGERRGVAPEADLLIGKVLDDQGGGTDSMVIAGMEWAAARADVVNMSLGGWDVSDGTDPMSQAVDALTKQYGTLFVAAAGNDGPEPGVVTAPAAAASALTVGAVDRNDKLADFSSRGPLAGTRAAKPELVAPGVDILAARAAGTTMGRPLDGHYTAASGTSMAAPHVAGAAALLAQRHPDWPAGKLKAALVGAADPLPDGDAYQIGAGRLNAARALGGTVAGQDLIDLGTFTHPQSGTAATPLSWTNTGTAAATLDLSVSLRNHDGRSGPAGAATLSAGKVTVAAGGTGEATLRLDRARLAALPGLYTATVTARAGGAFVAGTPVTFFVEAPSAELSLSVTARPDAPAGADQWGGVRVVSLDDPTAFNDFPGLDPGTPATVRVPHGRYSVVGYQFEDDPATGGSRMILIGDPEVVVTADTSLVFDTAEAQQARGSVDGVPTEAVQIGATFQQYARNGEFANSEFAFAWGADARRGGVLVMPMAKPGTGRFEAYTSFSLRAPGDGPSPYLYDLVRALPDGFPADQAYRWTAADQARLARVDQSFRVLDRKGAATAFKRYGWTADYLNVLEADQPNLSGDRVDYVTPGFRYKDEAFYDGTVTQEAHYLAQPGSRQSKVWVRQPLRPDWYDDPGTSTSGCTPGRISRARGSLHVELVELADQHQRFSCHVGDPEWEGATTRKLTLHRDGRLVGEATGSAADFTIPRQAGSYRLAHHLDTGGLLPVSTRVDTAWTFRSAGPAGTNRVPVALFSVDYALPLDLANKPTGGTATFHVRQAHGVPTQKVTSFALWTSVDDGASWQTVPTGAAGAGAFTAQLPEPAAGQAVSLRVKAGGDGGSGLEQSIIRAYLG